jgi:hypothetical protein
MPAEAELRQKRHKAILEILRHQSVARQTQLVELLRQKGIEATQSSVSRDLKQLGIAKIDVGYAETKSVPVKDAGTLPLFSTAPDGRKSSAPYPGTTQYSSQRETTVTSEG